MRHFTLFFTHSVFKIRCVCYTYGSLCSDQPHSKSWHRASDCYFGQHKSRQTHPLCSGQGQGTSTSVVVRMTESLTVPLNQNLHFNQTFRWQTHSSLRNAATDKGRSLLEENFMWCMFTKVSASSYRSGKEGLEIFSVLASCWEKNNLIK